MRRGQAAQKCQIQAIQKTFIYQTMLVSSQKESALNRLVWPRRLLAVGFLNPQIVTAEFPAVRFMMVPKRH
jgi:hypothetical protein